MSEVPPLVSSRITSRAPGTVMVISTIVMPPSQTASAAIRASRGEDARTTGTMPISIIQSRTFCLSICVSPFPRVPLTRDARSDSFHHLHHFLQSCHGRVARRRHGQCTVRGTAFHRPLRLLSRQESVNQAGSERIASSYAIENLQVLAVSRLVELAIAIANRAPIIQSRSLRFPERGGNH